MIYVIGGRGFVGSAYVRLLERLGLPHMVVTRENYDGLRGTACDVLINANGNSRKFLADRDPLWEFDASVRSVAESLHAFRASRYVFLSSGDVYPDPSSPATTGEDSVDTLPAASRYGRHKWMAEQLVRGEHRNWLIFRMGGFVGPGLRKNAIFDMVTGAAVRLAPESELQFIQTDHAAALVWSVVSSGVAGEVFNLGGGGRVHLGDLHAECKSASEFEAGAPVIRYELALDKLRRAAGSPIPDSLAEVRAFVRESQSL
ncbi:MAG: NAD-dependent epimerase/dehydratase family protein [Magnetospirillum sp.]|nr:NAD-dependent epimerase/dehydratase family protein [Magnetospirillum sp.]